MIEQEAVPPWVPPKVPPGVPRNVEVRRSARRRKTVTARREGDTIVVILPARLTRAQEQAWVDRMVARVVRSERVQRPTDAELAGRAGALSRQLFDGAAQPSAVTWSAAQQSRWGSCTLTDRTIRLSIRLQAMPVWVQDYVLVHELAHLMEADHNAAFWALVRRYPQAERARGFLEGHDLATRRGDAPGAPVAPGAPGAAEAVGAPGDGL